MSDATRNQQSKLLTFLATEPSARLRSLPFGLYVHLSSSPCQQVNELVDTKSTDLPLEEIADARPLRRFVALLAEGDIMFAGLLGFLQEQHNVPAPHCQGTG